MRLFRALGKDLPRKRLKDSQKDRTIPPHLRIAAIADFEREIIQKEKRVVLIAKLIFELIRL